MDLLFTPVKLGTCELKNRIVRSATNGHLSDEKGQVTPLWADTLIELAKNEVGLVITGHFCVDKMQRADAGQPVLDEATDESLLRRACDGVHRYGGKLFFQLSHSGIKGVESVNGAPPKPPPRISLGKSSTVWLSSLPSRRGRSGGQRHRLQPPRGAEDAVLSGRAHLRAGLCRKAQKRRAGREQMPCLQRLLHDLPQALCALRAASGRDRAVQNHPVVKKNGRAGAFCAGSVFTVR